MESQHDPAKVTEPPAPASADPVELRATEIARRRGRSRVTDEDRHLAYEELRHTAPPHPRDEPASH